MFRGLDFANTQNIMGNYAYKGLNSIAMRKL